MVLTIGTKVVIQADQFDRLIGCLREEGFRVLGPMVGEGAVVYGDIACSADLPAGLRDRSEPGAYRLEPAGDGRFFGYTLGAQGWKRYLYPPRQRLFRAKRGEQGFSVVPEEHDEQPMAFIGVRACELAAIKVQDAVFNQPGFAEPGYVGRRRTSLIIAVECAHASATCFCASAGSGPAVGSGFDLLLNELMDGDQHLFVAEAGSESGLRLLAKLDWREANTNELAAAKAQPAAAAAAQTRHLRDDARELLARSLDSRHWEKVAGRCLTCGNCTMVCPTCFCTSVEDVTDLAGENAERWRRWDSCFSIDYSYIHGGSARTSGASRYRQWISHKLSTWHEQFGTSGCIGCGRCIAWCPVGIDITAELDAIAEADEGR